MHTVLDLPDGSRARIVSVDGSGGCRSRLLALGFTPGSEIEVTDSAGGGRRVCVRGSCVVLDPAAAGLIRCDAALPSGNGDLP